MIYLALFDFIPNLAFLTGAYFLVRLAVLVRGKACSGIAIAGVALIFLGGFLQALWKLLFATGTADVRLLSNLQFILLAPGFVALLAAVILLARGSGKKVVPPVAIMLPWKIPFLIVMVCASLAAYGLLAFIAFRRQVFSAGAGFVAAILCILAMGGMASSEQTIQQQWLEEIVNAVGQIAFAAGSYLLYQDFRGKSC